MFQNHWKNGLEASQPHPNRKVRLNQFKGLKSVFSLRPVNYKKNAEIRQNVNDICP